MGDRYQTATDLDADIESAEATAARLRDWMISQEVIVSSPTDCVLGEKPGYAPGKNYTLAVREPYPLLFELRTNGVAFISEHSVFYSAGIGDIILVCSACGNRFGANDAWSAAVDDWYNAGGRGMLACEHCGVNAPITEWQHDPPWAFGNVGIQFWNWPALRDDFLTSVSDVVGHKFRLVYGKM